MQTYPLLVIGSGPAGFTAAASYLKAGGPGPVLLVSSDMDDPYMRPPLSKDVLAGAAEAEGTPIGEEPLPEDVEVRLSTTVTDLDLTGKQVTAGGEEIGFDRLVVATGAVPMPMPDADPNAEVFTLRSLDDARRLDAAARRARTALVIGSGFIGCEAAASLGRRGVATTLVTPEEHLQGKRLGEYAGAAIAGWLREVDVEIRTETRVTSIEAPRTAHLSDGTTLAPDLILAAVGIGAAAGDLLEQAGLQMYQGRVVTDQYLSAAPGVWVAGDAARATNATAGRPISVEHWGDALAMGELAGQNAAADEDAQQPWEDVPGFWSTIGSYTLKYSAWGDGHERTEVVERPGGFTVWYADGEDKVVGLLTAEADDDYERGEELIAAGAPLAEALNPSGDPGRQQDEAE